MRELDIDVLGPVVACLAAIVALGLYTKYTQSPAPALAPLDGGRALLDDHDTRRQSFSGVDRFSSGRETGPLVVRRTRPSDSRFGAEL